jgi:hypothetical protein
MTFSPMVEISLARTPRRAGWNGVILTATNTIIAELTELGDAGRRDTGPISPRVFACH